VGSRHRHRWRRALRDALTPRCRRLAAAVVLLATSARADDVPLARGEIVIADHGGRGVAGALYRLQPGSPPRRITTSAPLAMPTAAVIDRDGTLVVAELRLDEPGRLVRVDPVSGAVEPIADGWPLLTPVAVVLDDAGDLLVADLDAGSRLDFARGSLAGTGAIYRVPRSTGVPAVLSHDCCRWNASALAATATGALAVVDMGFQVFHGDGALTLVDPVNGVQRTLATSRPLLDPAGVVADAAGTLFVTDATNPQVGTAAILAVEPSSGTVTVLSAGAPITDPRALAVGPQGDLVVVDSGARAVYRITLPERTLEILATGDPLVTPYGVAVAW
jgi:sugar lactone lactonase YvrE